MEKKKIHIEYMLSAVSGTILWNSISTTSGLESWFADKVTANEEVFTFQWGKNEIRTAKVVNMRTGSFIRFHWEDEENEKSFFELKISVNELTNDYMLEVIDFAEPGEEDDLIELWNSQFEMLRRASGV